jgi:predicted TIM-barrel fold metal-dependent hydrolase
LRRREFLSSLTVAALAARATPAKFPVVDSHMHVWTNDTARFPFAHPYESSFKPPPIAGTMEALVEEMDRSGVDGCVLVQVIYYGWDNRYTTHCLKTHPQRFRAQGLIDPTDPERARKLEYWVREHKLSGMRFSPIYYRGKDEWINDRASDALWKSAEKLGAIFNFFIAAPQLPKLEDMVKRHAGVKVVVDHLARVELKGPDPDGDVRKLVALARYPNVSVKVSELNILSPSKKYPYADTFETIRRVYDAFGADRLLWGTGFPGATRAQAGRPSLDEELALIRREIPFFSAEDREKILGRNTARLWKFQF